MTTTEYKKQVYLYIHPKIKKEIQTTKTNTWIQTQIKQYQPQLQIPPIPHHEKIPFRPRLTQTTLNQLQQIPGRNTTQKINNLYYNQQQRNKKEQKRKEILKKLFPNNPHI